MLKFTYLTTAILLIAVISSCHKEVAVSDIATSPDFIKILNINFDEFGIPCALDHHDNGGYSITYSTNKDFKHSDIGYCLIDENGNLINNTLIGGTKNEQNIHSVKGENGSRYIVGRTWSPELRMDQAVTQTDKPDAYIAKFDKEGNKLWERGYSDTSGGFRGSVEDLFFAVVYRNGKVYCFGKTENYRVNYTPFPSPDMWLVVFDENGNKLKERLLPSLKLGQFGSATSEPFLELSNGDVILGFGVSKVAGFNIPQDTSCMLLRYNLESDSVLWVEYYETASPAGDPWSFGEASNGDIIALNSWMSEILTFSATDGQFLGAKSTNLEPRQFSSSDQHLLSVDGFHYIIGSESNGLSLTRTQGGLFPQVNNSRPWIMKFTDNGEMTYSKTYDIPDGRFTSIIPESNDNLKILGRISYFGGYQQAPFLMTINTDGDIIQPK